jgi:hypothetical protein
MCAYANPEHASYDMAQVCLNGHVINSTAEDNPEFNESFCSQCGAKTISFCPGCNAKIRGHLRGVISGGDIDTPAFCYNCGRPYPWVEASLSAAKELADELDDLAPDEREALKGALNDLVSDTPKTTVAVVRFKKLMSKAGRVAAESLKKILMDVVTEAVRRQLWP